VRQELGEDKREGYVVKKSSVNYLNDLNTLSVQDRYIHLQFTQMKINICFTEKLTSISYLISHLTKILLL